MAVENSMSKEEKKEKPAKPSTARILGIIALIAILAAAGYYYTTLQAPAAPTSPKVPAKDAIVVGFPASLTGRYELLGKQGLNGLQMWAEQVNKTGGIFVKEYNKKLPVKIVYYDDRSDKDTTVRLMERLIVEDKADFVFPPYSSGLTFATSPISEKYKRLAFAWGASSDDIWQQGYRYVVGVYTPAAQYHYSALDLFAKNYPKAKIALVAEDEVFSVASDKGAEAYAKKLGLEVVYKDRYPQNPTDLSPILLKIKDIKPDGIFVSGHLKDNVLFVKQLAELKVDVKFVSVVSGAAATSFGKDTGKASDYILAPSQWEVVQIDPGKIPNWAGVKISPKDWAAEFKAKYGYQPDYRAAGSYAAAVILQVAVEKAGSLDSEKVRDAIVGLDVTTLFGKFKVDPTTLNQIGHEMVLIQWLGGKKVVVYPPEFAEGKPVISMPMWAERK